jgi:molecular chaperone GrpE
MMTDKKQPSPEDTPPVRPAADSPDPHSHPLPKEGPDTDDVPAQEGLVPEVEPDHDELKHLKSKLKKKDGEARQLKKERDDLRDQLLRKMADMENLKKRVEREKSDYTQYALTDFVKTILPILDNLERALGHPDEGNGPSLQEGIRLIHKQFVDTLGKNGVSPIQDVVHQKFDPAIHHALATEESDDVQEPQVIEEMQRGYTLHDRLLRPALVRVRIPRKTRV